MTMVQKNKEKSCLGCGEPLHMRNEIEMAWRDKRYCSSSCQRRAATVCRNGLVHSRKPIRLTPVF